MTFLSQPTYAASPFDNVIDKARTLKISGANGACTTDITGSWLTLLQQASVGGPQFPYYSQYLVDAYNQLVENQTAGSGWGLWEMRYQGKYSVQLVIFPPETDFVFEYTSSGTPVPILNGYHDALQDVYFIEMSMYDCSYPKYTVRGPAWETVGEYPDHISYQNFDNPSNISYMVETKVFFINYDTITYPSGYEGEVVPTSSAWADLDGDGLIAEEEAFQGTSNLVKDTDGDGLDDFKESELNPDRDEIFCGNSECAYPTPTEKDVYIEIDWMKDSSNRTFKPTNTQLELVEDMFAAKSINFHADVGQFGGGNELATYTHDLRQAATSGQVDYWDYVNGGDGVIANFSSDRNSIWRYMIYGYKYFGSMSTGWAEAMGDNLFISGGLIEDMSGLVSTDRAVANTMAHEIGHNLCLSDEQVFVEQPAECVYKGIDNDDTNDSYYNLENYESVMNYRYQLTDQDDVGVVDYSDGSNGTDDHDDWSAVASGMGGFSGAKTYLGAEIIAKQHIITPDGDVIIEEAPIEGVRDTGKETTSIHNSDGENGNNSASEEPPQSEVGERETDPTPNENRPLERTLWVLGSGIVAVILGGSIVWYIRSRQK
ncbi:MAG TPA: hypothetical protein VFT59_00995 [Candidatus Saccharimonadales bacterium]|nr:hypothetical protein [Candidatus Saccharimonadales bacterium]